MTALMRSGSEKTNILIFREVFAESMASTIGFLVSSGKMITVLLAFDFDILLITFKSMV
jgi:hypothetical protein